MRMRTIDQVAEYVRAIDPDTALTKTAIRRKVIAGEIPSSKAGRSICWIWTGWRNFCLAPLLVLRF